MIHVKNLHKYFGNVRAVDDISFNVARGEVVGLLGPNGAGKTTSMRVIVGYLAADKGLVTVDGINVDEFGIEARKRIGYLPENAPVYADMEVTEYLAYLAALREIPSGECAKRIGGMVEVCGLGDVVGRPIGELSKGFRQRVGLAAALIHEPPVLVLDEPTSGLDPNQIVEIRDLIRRIGRERTVILSTHIMQEVEATCSRAFIINNGKLVGEGTIEELIRKGRGSHANYTVGAGANRKNIENSISKLTALNFGEWLSSPDEKRQRFTLVGDGDDRSEEIFRWAVSEGFVLSELKRDTASLEDVFRELTQNI